MPTSSALPSIHTQFERVLYMHQQMLKLIATLYKTQGLMVTECARDVGVAEGAIALAFRLVHASDEQAAQLGNFTIKLLSSHAGQFTRQCTFNGHVLLNEAIAFKGPLPAQPVFFAQFATKIVELLAHISATPEAFQAKVDPATNPDLSGFVKQIVAIQELPPVERFVATLIDGSAVSVEKFPHQDMPVAIGGYVYSDGNGHAEFFRKELVH